jgi:hypothetical protein
VSVGTSSARPALDGDVDGGGRTLLGGLPSTTARSCSVGPPQPGMRSTMSKRPYVSVAERPWSDPSTVKTTRPVASAGKDEPTRWIRRRLPVVGLQRKRGHACGARVQRVDGHRREDHRQGDEERAESEKRRQPDPFAAVIMGRGLQPCCGTWRCRPKPGQLWAPVRAARVRSGRDARKVGVTEQGPPEHQGAIAAARDLPTWNARSDATPARRAGRRRRCPRPRA